MRYNEDYKIADILGSYKDKDDVACIEILTGDFKGVKFNFGSVKIEENEAEDGATLSFDYQVLKENDEPDPKSEEFEKVLEEIMNSLLLRIVENEGYKDNESGKENTATADQG